MCAEYKPSHHVIKARARRPLTGIGKHCSDNRQTGVQWFIIPEPTAYKLRIKVAINIGKRRNCVVGLLVLLAVACNSTSPTSGSRPSGSLDIDEAREGRGDYFSSNLHVYRFAEETVAEAIDVLKEFNQAVQHQQISALEENLSEDFVLRYGYVRDGDVVYEIQDRVSFLARRSRWVEKAEPVQTIQISLKDLQRPDSDTLEILAAVTFKSAHFAPRFIGRYRFDRSNDKWRISELVLVQSLPPYPALYDLEIGFAEFREGYFYYPANLGEKIIAEGPEYPFDVVFDIKRSVKSRSEHAPLVIVFREPPPEGAILWIVEEQIGRNNVLKTRVEVQHDGMPYYWLTGVGWEGGPYDVRVRVLMEQEGETITLARDVLSLL